MSELPSQSPEELGLSLDESRFGDERVILNTLEHGVARSVGDIDQFFNDIAPHRNVVELAYAKIEVIGSRGENKLVVVSDDETEILAVFKPDSLRSKEFRDMNELGDDYPRERAAYFVSKHFGFDLVPPTTIRTIDNRTGSLQEFISRDEYRAGSDIARTTNEQMDMIMDSDDVKKLCILDWIIGNADRHSANYLVNLNTDPAAKGRALIAIDNGMGFNSKFYRTKSNLSVKNEKHGGQRVPGPYVHLTFEVESNKPITTTIPEELLAQIADGYQRMSDLDQDITGVDGISLDEAGEMRYRIELLLDKKVFLSGNNFSFITKDIA
ncbi:MAG: hypothetical protein AAB613_01160 [Patescibacteria group bacterium]